jgi:hypothetical protein
MVDSRPEFGEPTVALTLKIGQNPDAQSQAKFVWPSLKPHGRGLNLPQLARITVNPNPI